MSSSTPSSNRRRLLRAATGAGALAALGAPALVRAQAVKLRIGYWPVAAGLPFYAAVEKGYFKEAGIDYELVFADLARPEEVVAMCDGILASGDELRAVVNVAGGSAAYGARFACAAQRDNVYGVQFHPEKSSAAGLRLLANFAGICASVPA